MSRFSRHPDNNKINAKNKNCFRAARVTKTWLLLLLIIISVFGISCRNLVGIIIPQELPATEPSPLPTKSKEAAFTPTVRQNDFETLAVEEQLDIFEELWDIVNDEYLYEDFNGFDWQEAYEAYGALIEDGLSTPDFYLAMDEMLYSLGDEHSVFLDPLQVAEEELAYAGESDYVGIGVWLGAVPQRHRVVVYLVFPGSPAEQAGIRMHDTILLADGKPALDGEGYITEDILGEVGQPITLLVHTIGEEPRQITLKRAEVSSHIPVPHHLYTSPDGKHIGYILLASFTESGLDEQVQQSLLDMSQDAPLDGLIIDNRINEGGYDDVAGSVLRFFVDGVVGHFVNRQGQEALNVHLQDVAGSSQVPLVVLVGPETYSFGEIFSGILADQQRAYIIGETTDGNVETLWVYDFRDGSQAWIAHDTFQPLNQPDADWEQSGIIPDQEVPTEWDLFNMEDDPAVEAALTYFDQQ